MDSDIPLKVHQSFHQSVDQGHIYLYDSTATHNVDDDPRSFPQTGHVVPQLGDKPQVPPKRAASLLPTCPRGPHLTHPTARQDPGPVHEAGA